MILKVLKIFKSGISKVKYKLLLNKFQPQKMYLVDPWKYESDFIYKKALYGGNFSSLEGQKILDDRYEKVKLKFQKQINPKQSL